VKATKETLSPTRVKLTVEVPFDELKPSVDAAYRKFAREFRVSGFRPGKVPPRILDQRLGRGVILEEAIQKAVPGFYTNAARQEDVNALSHPELGISSFTDGASLVFTAEVDVRPDITLPDYDGIEITVDPAAVTDEQVDARLTAMREQCAVLTPVERPAQTGDFISLDLRVTVDGEVIDDSDITGVSYDVGSDSLLHGLDAAVVGAGAGESRVFETQLLASEYVGRSAEATATIRGVKARVLPELDDDFATTASEFDSLDELLADVRESLAREAEANQRKQARERLLDTLIERVDVPLPESVLDSEVEAREHRFAHELEAMDIDRGAYLKLLGQTEQEYLDEVRRLAVKALKSQFLLDAVVDAEDLSVNQDDLMEQLVLRARSVGASLEAFIQRLSERGGLSALKAEALRGQALTVLLQRVKTVDTAGNTVELALPGPSAPTAAATEDAEDTGHGGAEDTDGEIGTAPVGEAADPEPSS
jgi:trigger factor